MSSTPVKAAAFLFCAAVTAVSAYANPGQGFTWSFQTTSLNNYSSSAQTVAMMRNGLAWPVVVTDYSTQGGYGSSATLFPTASSTAGTSPTTTWQNIGSGFFSNMVYRLRGASSPDGRVAFAGADSSGQGLGGRVSSVTGGWGALPSGTKAVAFDPNGTLYTATNNSVSGVGGYTGLTIVDMAVSPFGEVGVIASDMKFWQYSGWLGTWTSITLPNVGPTPYLESMDVEYDSFGRPHVVATVSNSLVAWDFSTVTGKWESTTLAGGLNSSLVRATLAANADGTVGTAWIDGAGQLIYGYKHDLDNWATTVVTNVGSSSSNGMVGVTFDYADLPVLSYRNYTNSAIMVAYDPIVVPEPAALSLAAVAALVTLSRRSRRAAA